MPAPEVNAFGDGAHNAGETGLTIGGGGFGAFPGSAWIYENSDRTGVSDQLTVLGWNDIELSGVDIPASPANSSGTRYLFLQREDLAWSNAFAFTLTAGGVVLTPVDIAQAQVLDAVGLTQTHVLAVADIAQAQVLDGVGLSQTHVLAVGELAQLQVLDGAGLVIEGTLVPVDIAQANVLDSLAISQAHVLPVADIAQLQVLDAIFSGQIRWLSASRLRVYPSTGQESSRFSRLWVAYDSELRLEDLVDEDGLPVTDATVELTTLTDRAGNAVEGILLPTPMLHISGGDYQCALPATLGVTADKIYKATARAVANGAAAPFTETLIAARRAI
jgi:hypothetical protein